MAFDNVTFFEVHVDGLPTGSSGGEETADVGPTVTAELDAEETMDAVAPADESTPAKGRKGKFLALIAFATAVSVIARRRRRTDSDDGEAIDVDTTAEETADTESVTA